MTYKEKRNYLIEMYARTVLLDPNGLCYVDGIGYRCINNKLVICDILESAVVNGELIIDTVFDVLDSVLNKKVKSRLRVLNLGTISKLSNDIFSECRNLHKVIATKIKTLPDRIFYNCSKLEQVYMPQVVRVGEEAFYNCILKKYKFGNLSYIGNRAFYNTQINELVCGVVDIQNYGLYGMEYLKSFKAKKISYLCDIFLSCDFLEYLDIGEFSDIEYNYDKFSSIDRVTKIYNSLGVTDCEKWLKEDKLMFKSISKNKIDDSKYIINDTYTNFIILKNLKEFHYSLKKKTLEEQKYYESRFNLLKNKINGLQVIRDE